MEYGPPGGLTVVEAGDLEPGPGEVLVRVHAAAVNFPDVLIVANRYQVPAPLPFTPGSEFAGVVAALGPGVSGPPVGSPVAGAVLTGAFAEQVVVPAASLRHVPEGLDMVHAAAFHVTYATAYHCLVTVGQGSAGSGRPCWARRAGSGRRRSTSRRDWGCAWSPPRRVRSG